ncbi:hypothetical protein COU95_02405 [Candidatus Shapirobacteria bacterium CG10_big_fil_rev_8_21_14_0_10_40_9]|uniref:YrhK domain-containing protein n=1 Tax=Candidatus Shapirobacteria bacterium CG10_big_fil_rev_8_21_14_0_10_40_9 TaxID=1974888 RepID=A0A2M8L3F1_9BACT|nr:MAG: hypothetical protein COU95_02405 [Candidatus Shapirobacteria bacterium CG10_big_fil_rev_8_21_14_0_10_40_9]
MRELNQGQLKALSEFANMIAAAWFSAGVISPFFTKPESFSEVLKFLSVGLVMAWATLSWSLTLLKEEK